jgi:hypothetical protein
MASQTPLPLPSGLKRLHMLSVAHNETDLFDRQRQIPRRDLGDSKNVPMTAQAEAGIDIGLEVMGIGRSPEYRAHHVSGPYPHLVMYPTLNSRPYMARHTGYVLVRGSRPAVVGRRDDMAAGAELRPIGERNRNAAEREHSGQKSQCDRSARFQSHALVEHDGGNVS